MKKIYFREERINLVQSGIPLKKIKKTYSWCVDPKNKNYNNFLEAFKLASMKIFIEMIIYTISLLF